MHRRCFRRSPGGATASYAASTVMQLYILIYQHPSIVESCWRQIVPIFNHTIRKNIEEFKNKNPYQVSGVLKT